MINYMENDSRIKKNVQAHFVLVLGKITFISHYQCALMSLCMQLLSNMLATSNFVIKYFPTTSISLHKKVHEQYNVLNLKIVSIWLFIIAQLNKP